MRLRKADLLVLVTAVIWGVVFSVIKGALKEFDPMAFTSLRFLASSALLVLLVLMLAPALAQSVQVIGGSPFGVNAGVKFALVPLLWLTSRRDLMGGWVNRRVTTVVGAVIAALIIGLNAHLLLGLVL